MSCNIINRRPFFFSILLLLISTAAVSVSAAVKPKTFNVVKYGAVANGVSDISQAFMKAWEEACEWKGVSRVLIPHGTYRLNSVVFRGPCNNLMVVIVKGVLRAPTDPNLFFSDHWISFRYLNGLVIKGGGSLNAEGPSAWSYNDCSRNSQCKTLPTTMRLDFVNYSRIHHIHYIDSKNVHLSIFASNYVNVSHVKITAPEHSPNTDGIHVAGSTNIAIRNSEIGTGDDCIAVLSGTDGLDISGVSCGPGHGISIGSLGRYKEDEFVKNVRVRNCTLTGTQNGLRIKTWAPSLASHASDLTYQNILMKNVSNPIFIDQQYCPFARCDISAKSSVQISNVKFSNIWGMSNTKEAVILKCSGLVPCKNVKLENINLAYHGRGGPAVAQCKNVHGGAYGVQRPSGCM
ncbi:exopolygalacturonase-like [Impatiens glandulifera]|uniref:exopolygalacturonase-like n=1 Tax=Impatiens glandulifera TaxID=253017 RepID=UPI001FB09B45|nr:exopolygalacturonase-like [Impatiens glandulifera]